MKIFAAQYDNGERATLCRKHVVIEMDCIQTMTSTTTAVCEVCALKDSAKAEAKSQGPAGELAVALFPNEFES